MKEETVVSLKDLPPRAQRLSTADLREVYGGCIAAGGKCMSQYPSQCCGSMCMGGGIGVMNPEHDWGECAKLFSDKQRNMGMGLERAIHLARLRVTGLSIM